jgi:hypothetical protein
MDEPRPCSACDAYLTGPFQPRITLTQVPPPQETEGEKVTVAARAWICPACGLVHWYAEDQDLGRVPVVEPEAETELKSGTSYERRSQMMRMLRRVRRM